MDTKSEEYDFERADLEKRYRKLRAEGIPPEPAVLQVLAKEQDNIKSQIDALEDNRDAFQERIREIMPGGNYELPDGSTLKVVEATGTNIDRDVIREDWPGVWDAVTSEYTYDYLRYYD